MRVDLDDLSLRKERGKLKESEEGAVGFGLYGRSSLAGSKVIDFSPCSDFIASRSCMGVTGGTEIRQEKSLTKIVSFHFPDCSQ